jgi:hypothetical protein
LLLGNLSVVCCEAARAILVAPPARVELPRGGPRLELARVWLVAPVRPSGSRVAKKVVLRTWVLYILYIYNIIVLMEITDQHLRGNKARIAIAARWHPAAAFGRV